jgi:hypothetical protein
MCARMHAVQYWHEVWAKPARRASACGGYEAFASEQRPGAHRQETNKSRGMMTSTGTVAERQG